MLYTLNFYTVLYVSHISIQPGRKKIKTLEQEKEMHVCLLYASIRISIDYTQSP